MSRYSWKAIVCCVSKSVLIMGVAASALTALILVTNHFAENAKDHPDKLPAWVQYFLASLFIGFFVILVLSAICHETIPYCQVAVETKRKPWYWLPWVGDPLPPRRTVICESCGKPGPETEEAYRARLGLPPLEKERDREQL